jgi:hypothetical protein
VESQQTANLPSAKLMEVESDASTQVARNQRLERPHYVRLMGAERAVCTKKAATNRHKTAQISA